MNTEYYRDFVRKRRRKNVTQVRQKRAHYRRYCLHGLAGLRGNFFDESG